MKRIVSLAAALFAGIALAAQAAPLTQAEIEQAVKASGGVMFPIGRPNTGFAKYFTGDSYLHTVQNKFVSVHNVTFAPGTINHWHKHHGSCQVLSGVSGKGYYQIWGEPVKELLPGESVTIPEHVKHWHGAQGASWFQHLSIMKEGSSPEWLEPVDQKTLPR